MVGAVRPGVPCRIRGMAGAVPRHERSTTRAQACGMQEQPGRYSSCLPYVLHPTPPHPTPHHTTLQWPGPWHEEDVAPAAPCRCTALQRAHGDAPVRYVRTAFLHACRAPCVPQPCAAAPHQGLRGLVVHIHLHELKRVLRDATRKHGRRGVGAGAGADEARWAWMGFGAGRRALARVGLSHHHGWKLAQRMHAVRCHPSVGRQATAAQRSAAAARG